jgi:hypothetical protein
MANPNKPKDLKCRIINIEPDPKHPNRTIVSVKIDDAAGEPYIRAFAIINPDRPLSLEEFTIMLEKKDLSRPADPFFYLKEAQEQSSEFVINVITPDQTTE